MSVGKPSLQRILDILQMEGLPPGAKLVLLALADRAGDDGTCYPSHDYLARKCGFSRVSVIKHLAYLEDAKLISVQRRTKATRGGKKAKTSNLYTLLTHVKILNMGIAGEVKNLGRPCKENGGRGGKESEHNRLPHTGSSIPKRTGEKKFDPPTVDDVAAYLAEFGAHGINPERFVDHYTSNGWRVGKNPMKDWRAAVRTWISRQEEQGDPRLTPGERTIAARERARQREKAQSGVADAPQSTRDRSITDDLADGSWAGINTPLYQPRSTLAQG